MDARRGTWSECLVIDLDSTICEVCGKAKHGADYGYTKKLGYHPILATWANRRGAPRPDAQGRGQHPDAGSGRFVEELVARVRRAGARGELIMRFDSGFWSNATIATLERLEVGYTMGVRMVKSVVRAVAGIDEAAWMAIDYPEAARPKSPSASTTVSDSSCAAPGSQVPKRRCGPSGATSPS